jgi:hypothetical protein
MAFAGSAGDGIESGASDLDPAAKDARARLSGGRRREAAVAGGERRRDSPARPQSRVSGHDLRRGLRLREAREAARQSRAAVAVETRRSGGTAWRRCLGTPTRSLGQWGCTGSKQTAQDSSLPSCADPGWLTTTSRRRRRGSIGGGGNLGFRWRWRTGFGVWGTGGGGPGVAAP